MKKKKIKTKKPIKQKKVVKKIKKTKARKVVKPVKKQKVTKEQVETLIKKGEERGFLTTSEILYSLPTIERNVDELEKLYDELRERGVEIKEAREFLDLGGKKEKKQKKLLAGKIDPIQMYLKE